MQNAFSNSAAPEAAPTYPSGVGGNLTAGVTNGIQNGVSNGLLSALNAHRGPFNANAVQNGAVQNAGAPFAASPNDIVLAPLTGRFAQIGNFTEQEEETSRTRRFIGNGTPFLHVPGLLSVEGVRIGTTTMDLYEDRRYPTDAAGSYQTVREPMVILQTTPDGRPVLVRSVISNHGIWQKKQAIFITGEWDESAEAAPTNNGAPTPSQGLLDPDQGIAGDPLDVQDGAGDDSPQNQSPSPTKGSRGRNQNGPNLPGPLPNGVTVGGTATAGTGNGGTGEGAGAGGAAQ